MDVPSRYRESLMFGPDLTGLSGGHVGAAPREMPYWPLFGPSGEPWARLCLLFATEETAYHSMLTWFQEHSPALLSYGIARYLRNVKIRPQAEVRALQFHPEFWLWCRAVMQGGTHDTVPQSLIDERFDVLRVGRNVYPRDFEILIVTEEALESGRVGCTQGSRLVLTAD